MLEHKKLAADFKKRLQKLAKDGVSQAEITQYFDLIKESIQDDIKSGFKDGIARNLTLGIGVHAGDYPKYLILGGKAEGWQYITRYLLWQQHILQKLFVQKEVTPRSVGCIIGLSLLWGMDDLAKLSRDYFQLLFTEDAKKYQSKETHHLFMAILYDLHMTGAVNAELAAVLPKDEPYAAFLAEWATTDETRLGELLFALCDFHLYGAMDMKGKFSEILSLNDIPYEIRLIERIRAAKGLANVTVAHPLLETKLAGIPETKPEWDLAKDDVYQFLIRRE